MRGSSQNLLYKKVKINQPSQIVFNSRQIERILSLNKKVEEKIGNQDELKKVLPLLEEVILMQEEIKDSPSSQRRKNLSALEESTKELIKKSSYFEEESKVLKQLIEKVCQFIALSTENSGEDEKFIQIFSEYFSHYEQREIDNTIKKLRKKINLSSTFYYTRIHDANKDEEVHLLDNAEQDLCRREKQILFVKTPSDKGKLLKEVTCGKCLEEQAKMNPLLLSRISASDRHIKKFSSFSELKEIIKENTFDLDLDKHVASQVAQGIIEYEKIEEELNSDDQAEFKRLDQNYFVALIENFPKETDEKENEKRIQAINSFLDRYR